ncbi:MAG: hypothetical protein O3B04_10310, partial [Chloroflexi bacterium]|nr:hypothetical protein [Chloroflexota bacterium]
HLFLVELEGYTACLFTHFLRLPRANPQDSHLPLRQDRQHAPNPLTPLSGWLAERYWAKGASAGLAAVKQPIMMHIRRINTYYYLAVTPSVPPEQMEEAGHQAEASLKALIPSFADRWENEWLPEIRGYHDTWNAFDLKSATDRDLLAHLDWTLKTFTQLWSIHFEVAIPFLVAPNIFADLYSDLIDGAGPMDAFKLLQGVENISFRAGTDLWDFEQAGCQLRRGQIDGVEHANRQGDGRARQDQRWTALCRERRRIPSQVG